MTDLETTGNQEQFSYWFTLVTGTFRSMLDMAMLVLGSGLIALALTVVLDGFDLVGIGLEMSTGAMLATTLSLAIIGAFAFGIATEGGYGTRAVSARFSDTRVALGRAFAGLLIGALFYVAANRLAGLTEDLSYPMRVGQELLRAAGFAGLSVVPVLGVGGAYLGRNSLRRVGFGRDMELGLVYVVWVLGTVAATTIPAP